MNARLLRPADFTRQPWKNGGGVTTELAVEGAGRWLWRVSVAEVARSGDFSDFAGYERTLVLLEGDGMELTFDRAAPKVIDKPHIAFTFDGAWKTHCRLLGGPVKDLNLIVDRERARGSVAVLMVDGMRLTFDAPWVLLYGMRGCAELQWEGGGGAERIAAGELLRVDEGSGAQAMAYALEPGTLLADIRIH